MDLRILHITSPVTHSPFISAHAAASDRLPQALRERGHNVSVQVAKNTALAAAEARASNLYDVIHVHDAQDVRLWNSPGLPPVIRTSYTSAAGNGSPWVALSRAHARGQEDPLDIIPPALPADELPDPAAERGDDLAYVSNGQDPVGLAMAVAVARSVERPLAVLVPAGTELSAACTEILERHPRSSVRVAHVDRKACPAELADAAAYLSFQRGPFDMAAVVAMAHGTPVITLAGHPSAEVIVSGESGYVCESAEEAARAVERLDILPRNAGTVRARVVFDPATAAARLERLYTALREGRAPKFVDPEHFVSAPASASVAAAVS